MCCCGHLDGPHSTLAKPFPTIQGSGIYAKAWDGGGGGGGGLKPPWVPLVPTTYSLLAFYNLGPGGHCEANWP